MILFLKFLVIWKADMIKTERNCLLQFFTSEIKYSSQFSYAFLYRSKWATDGAYSDIFEKGDYFQI